MIRAAQHILLWPILLLALFSFHGCETTSPSCEEVGVPIHLSLNYNLSEYIYDGKEVLGVSSPQNMSISNDDEYIRYIIRIYPASQKSNSRDFIKEFKYTREFAAGYNYDMTIDLVPGEYDIMVWSDFLKNGQPIYDAKDFSQITLLGNHEGNNAYYDAYRGSAKISKADFSTNNHSINITMQRPLAKFEFIASDLVDFINKEMVALPASNAKADRLIHLEDYKVVFYYVGFMPDTYSMYTDRPVDSSTGVMFTSSVNKLSDTDASLGFDYVFVNEKESAVTVRVGVLDKNNELISLTPSIKVPLKRNHHTVLHNTYLTTKTSDGVSIDPNYNGDYNYIIP